MLPFIRAYLRVEGVVIGVRGVRYLVERVHEGLERHLGHQLQARGEGAAEGGEGETLGAGVGECVQIVVIAGYAHR